MEYSKREILVIELCNEIDEWKAEAKYWKDMYEKERDENTRMIDENLKHSQNGIANAMLLALSIKENEDGSLSIPKENRKTLADNFK